jgi:hypothetical protein
MNFIFFLLSFRYRSKHLHHVILKDNLYEGVTKRFRTGRLERELQTVYLSATRCSWIAILWVSLVSFAAINLCVASERVFIAVSIYFITDSIRKRLDTTSNMAHHELAHSLSTPEWRIHLFQTIIIHSNLMERKMKWGKEIRHISWNIR